MSGPDCRQAMCEECNPSKETVIQSAPFEMGSSEENPFATPPKFDFNQPLKDGQLSEEKIKQFYEDVS